MKKLSLVLALALLLTSLFTVMAGATAIDPSTLEPYTIKWYSLGEKADNHDAVVAKINEYLKKNFNAELDLIVNTNNDHLEKLKLITAAREAFDIAFVSTDYANYVAQEAFYPLKDLLNDYGQDILAQYPTALWDSVTIGGEIYAVPTHKFSCSHYYYAISVTASDAVGVDTAWVNDESLDKLGKWEAFKNWCYEMKAAGGDKNGYVTSLGTGPFDALYPTERIGNGVGAVLLGDDSFKGIEKNVVFNQYATPEFEAYVKDAYEMAQAGLIPLDPETSVSMKNFDPAVQTQDSMAKRLPGYEVTYGQDYEAYFINYAFQTTDKIYGSMNAISDTSEDPARAMMLINALIADTEFANLVYYGIEGQDYTRNEYGQIALNNPKTYNMTTWSLPGFLTAEPDTSLPIDMVDRYLAFNETLVPASNLGFAFDEEPVMTEMAAIRQVTAEYLAPLANGLSNPEENLPKFLDALNAAGAEDAIAEMQAQLSAWRVVQGYDPAN